MTDSTPRESDELRSFTITDRWSGQPITTGLEVCVVASGARPAGWTAAVIDEGRTCVRVHDLTAARPQRAFARVNGKAVIDLGVIDVS